MNKHIGIFEYQKAEKTKKIPKCHAHFFGAYLGIFGIGISLVLGR